MAPKKKFGSIGEYISMFPKEIRIILQKLRQEILGCAPGIEEKISYQMPSFSLNGRYLVYFAAWKSHIGFYAMPSGTAKFKKELSGYKTSKGTVQFPYDKPIPYGLVKRIVKFRIKENSEKK